MDFGPRHILDLACLAVALCAQWWLSGRLLDRSTGIAKYAVTASALLSIFWIAFGFIAGIPLFSRLLPYRDWVEWLRAGGLFWAALGVCAAAVDLAAFWWTRERSLDPGRRRLLLAARAAAVAAPAAVIGYGVFIERSRFRMTEVDLLVKDLPMDLNGLRLVQITDIHMGTYLQRRDVDRAVAMANETRPHLALVTGDLITVRRDPLESCVEALAKLRADAGVLGCLGNHEIVGRCEAEAARLGAAAGIRFLRGERVGLRFGSAVMNVAGVDYQRQQKKYLIGAERLIDPGAFNLLLSHNPDVFPVAARQGFDLTIAGHTHGGQVTVEILHQYLNVVRFFTPYIYGSYERDGRQAWVGRGLGTVGVPARVGAPPEVALIRLCAT